MPKFNWIAFRWDLQLLVGRPVDEQEARLVRRRLAAHHTLQEHACNRELTARERTAERRLEIRLAVFFGARLDQFSGDPRGATVKLHPVTDGERLSYFSHDWGGHLIFVGGE